MEAPLAFLVAFSLLWKFPVCGGVRCYRCLAETEDPADSASCRFFDGSARFVVDCPDSTLCQKRVVALDMLNDVNVGGIVKRFCAPQLLRGEHVKVKNTWKPTRLIHEKEYSETCDDITQEGRSTKTIMCTCRGDLCNHSIRLTSSTWAMFAGIVMMLLGTSYGSF